MPPSPAQLFAMSTPEGESTRRSWFAAVATRNYTETRGYWSGAGLPQGYFMAFDFRRGIQILRQSQLQLSTLLPRMWRNAVLGRQLFKLCSVPATQAQRFCCRQSVELGTAGTGRSHFPVKRARLRSLSPRRGL